MTADDFTGGLAEPEDLGERRDQAARLHAGLSAGAGRPDPAGPLRREVERAWRKIAEGDFRGAVGLADHVIKLDSAYCAGWLCKAEALARLGNLDLALAELRRARSAVKAGPDRTAIDDRHETFVHRRTDQEVELARRALRHDQPDEAVRRLTGCATALGDDQDFERRLTYARERAVARRGSPSRTTQLTNAALQSVLGWLCREEFKHGGQALADERFERAAELFGNARKLDRRNARAALHRAVALEGLVQATDFPDEAPRLSKALAVARQQATEAEHLAREAKEDRTLGDEAEVAWARIDNLRGWTVKYDRVFRCRAKLYELQDHYSKRQGWQHIYNSSFVPIAAEADRLLERYGKDDPDVGPAVAALADWVAAIREQVRKQAR